MRAIQITIDDALLKQLDRTPDAKKAGRSAIIREALSAWLKQRRRAEIREEYRRAYGAQKIDEAAGWAEELAWPED